MAQRHIGADPAIIADLDPGSDDAVGAYPAAMPQPRAAFDHHIRADIAVLGHDRVRIDKRGWRPACGDLLRRVERLGG
jgi:hypothetical protein